jgi:uncharacterized RDD family membrane protein YckC
MYSETATDHLPDPERQAEFYAGVTAKRGLAWIIDAVIIWAIALVLALVSIVGLFMIPLVVLAVGFLYRWGTLARGSATWGMRLMAIEFRNAWGERLGPAQAGLHVTGYYIAMSTLLLQVLSVGLMMVTARGQGLSDMVLGTVALNRRAGA